MRQITRFAAIATMGIALIAGSIAPALALAKPTLADIYNPLKVVKAELTLPQTSVDSLNNQATLTTYVPGSVAFSVDGKSSGSIDIKIRLKGSTSLYPLDETPSFKIKFQKDAAGQGYLGLNRMTLNGMVQDTSKLHEYGSYLMFNSMGVPAPKTGWVWLVINGVDKGLFANIEQPDQVFMQKRFKDITQHIYEGIYFEDFNFGNADGDNKTGSYLVDYGWKVTPNKNDLSNAIDYVNDWDPKTWYTGLSTVFDRTELINFIALENFLGHWDGYSGPNINNYYIRSNTRGKFSFIPWGTDQTFGEHRGTKDILGDNFYLPLISDSSKQPFSDRYHNRGRLYTQCVNYSVCRTAYLQALKAISAKSTSINLVGKMKAVAKVINPYIQKQFKSQPDLLREITSEQTRTYSYVPTRITQISKLLAKYKIK
jgi:CotH kinase protein